MILQMVLEVMAVSFVAITLALFTGHLLAQAISSTQIRNDSTFQATEGERTVGTTSHSLEGMGFRYEMTHEEMLDSYDIKMNMTMIITFYTLAVGSILLATAVPIIYITRLNLREILL